MFILMRGELHAMDLDKETMLYKLPEGSVFGEGTVLRQLEVGLILETTSYVFETENFLEASAVV